MFKRCIEYVRSWKKNTKKGGDGEEPNKPPPVEPEQPLKEPLLDNTQVPTEVPSEVQNENGQNTQQPISESSENIESNNGISKDSSQEPLLDNTQVPTEVPTEVPTQVPTEVPTDNSSEIPNEKGENTQQPISEIQTQEPLLDNTQNPTDNISEIPPNENGENTQPISENSKNIESNNDISKDSSQEPLLDNTQNPTEIPTNDPTGDNLDNRSENTDNLQQDSNENQENTPASEPEPTPEPEPEPQPEPEPEPEPEEPEPIIPIPIFIENTDDIFDKSTYTFIHSEIPEYTVYFSIYRINKTRPDRPFLQYLCKTTTDNSLTFPQTKFQNTDYPPNESSDDSSIDTVFTETITKSLLDITKVQIPDFSQIYRGVIPMSMDQKTNTILFVFVDFSEIDTESLNSSNNSDNSQESLQWWLTTDLTGFYIGLNKHEPIFQIDSNVKILFNEHYEISILKSNVSENLESSPESSPAIIKSPLTVFLCKYDVGTTTWSNIGTQEGAAATAGGSNSIFLSMNRQDHPFGYYPFASCNIIQGNQLSEIKGLGLKKYVFFVEGFQKTLYILPSVPGGDAPNQIDLYDGSVFKPVCLEEDPFSESNPQNEDDDELEQKNYSAIYFEDQGNVLWCVKNMNLLMESM